jgi:hypothetical protein
MASASASCSCDFPSSVSSSQDRFERALNQHHLAWEAAVAEEEKEEEREFNHHHLSWDAAVAENETSAPDTPPCVWIRGNLKAKGPETGGRGSSMKPAPQREQRQGKRDEGERGVQAEDQGGLCQIPKASCRFGLTTQSLSRGFPAAKSLTRTSTPHHNQNPTYTQRTFVVSRRFTLRGFPLQPMRNEVWSPRGTLSFRLEHTRLYFLDT